MHKLKAISYLRRIFCLSRNSACTLFVFALIPSFSQAYSQQSDHISACVEADIDAKIAGLIRTYEWADIFARFISMEVWRRKPDLGRVDATGHWWITSEKTSEACKSASASRISLRISGKPNGNYGYSIVVKYSITGTPVEITVDRPIGERVDVLPVTGAPKSAYVSQSMGMDLIEIGKRVASELMDNFHG